MIAEFSFKDVPPYYGLFIVGVLLLILGMRRLRKKRQTKPRETMMADKNFAASDMRAMADELNRLFADLQETARRLAAQVQNRAAKLELLITEADEKIKRLEALTGAIPHGNEAARSGLTPPPPARPDTAHTPEDPKYRRIYELADAGKNPREIAQEVGAPAGEVELILNLRGKVLRA